MLGTVLIDELYSCRLLVTHILWGIELLSIYLALL
jgi:hypothetical protein